jgi:YD repeat-containing protein
MTRKNCAFLALIICFTACKKKDNPAPNNNNNNNNGASGCFLKTIKNDSLNATLNYDNNFRLTSAAINYSGQKDSGIFLYDAGGHMIKEMNFDTPGDTVDYTNYDYNTAGKVVKVHHFNRGSIIFSESDYETWTYGTNNRPSKVAVYISNSSAFSLSNYSTYTYDANGNVISATSFDSSNTLLSVETYQYDNKKPAKHFQGNAGDVMNDNPNNVTDDVLKDASGKIVSHVTSSFEYDSKGNPTKETDTDETGVKTVYYYTYLCR